MNLEHLLTFQRLAREKNFSGTAESLGISQPTVTLRIKELEEQTGQLLVQRIGQHVSLTEAGETLLSHTNRILRVLEAGREAMQAKTPPNNQIKLATTSSICSYLLPQFFKHWHGKHSHIIIKLYSSHTQEVLHMIQDGAVDVGIVRGLSFAPLQSAVLYYDPIRLVVAPNHPLAKEAASPPISIERLEGEPFIIYRSHAWELVKDVFCTKGLFPREIAELSHIFSVKKWVRSGAGIAFLPYSTIKKEVERRELMMVRVRETADIHFPTQAVFLNSAPVSIELERFLAELKTFTEHFPFD